jgi:hypothetical protein
VFICVFVNNICSMPTLYDKNTIISHIYIHTNTILHCIMFIAYVLNMSIQ